MSVTVPRAPRRRRQFWLDHVTQWQSSGLSKAAYCQLHSLNAGSFYNWSRPARVEHKPETGVKRHREAKPMPDESLSFLPVSIKASESCTPVRVVRAGTDVALPADLNAEQIHNWLSVIHQLHV